MLQWLSLWPSMTAGYVALSSAAHPEQEMQRLSPTQMSTRRQRICVQLSRELSYQPHSEISLVSQTGWWVPCSYWLMLCRLLVAQDKHLYSIVFLLSACNVAKASVFLCCFFFLMLSSVSLLLHCTRKNWDLFFMFKAHFYKKYLRN